MNRNSDGVFKRTVSGIGLRAGAAHPPTNAARGRLDRLPEEVAFAKKLLDLPAEAPVTSCYEAGRDGFWIHRYLVGAGVDNLVVDSSSIEVNRRARGAKPMPSI